MNKLQAITGVLSEIDGAGMIVLDENINEIILYVYPRLGVHYNLTMLHNFFRLIVKQIGLEPHYLKNFSRTKTELFWGELEFYDEEYQRWAKIRFFPSFSVAFLHHKVACGCSISIIRLKDMGFVE